MRTASSEGYLTTVSVHTPVKKDAGGLVRDKMPMTDGAQVGMACAFCQQAVSTSEYHQCEGKRLAEEAQAKNQNF